jgi:hypothetical protein
MSVELWSAILDHDGPNYVTWYEIFGSGRVPLKSPRSAQATLGEETNVEVYLLNVAALTLIQRARLMAVVAQKFGVPIYEVEAEIAKRGFPIRAEDVIVSVDLRAFA